MLTVDNFLCCMKLETGGLVIGSFNVLLNVLGVLIGEFLVMVACFVNCDDAGYSVPFFNYDTYKAVILKVCRERRGVVIVVALYIIVFSIGFLLISIFCVRAIYRRNHFHITPLMVWMGALTALSFFEIFQLNDTHFISAALACFYHGYQLIILYSLYCLFQKEHQRSPATFFET